MKSFDWPRLCSSSCPRTNASSWCWRYFYFSLDHLKVLAVFMPVWRMEAVCAARVLYQFVVQHMIIDLWQTKKFLFLCGAIRLDIYLFMKRLATFSMDGPTIIKTWPSCCSEREDSSLFLPDLASLMFPAFWNPLGTLGFGNLKRS